jgi:hypothetical protein
MASAVEVLREREIELEKDINGSRQSFDLAAPLTADELKHAGLLGVLPGLKAEPPAAQEMPLLRDIEDTEEPVEDAVEAIGDRNSYNAQYIRYMKCQAIMSLVAFEEGWSAFEEMALKSFVQQAKREDEEYHGDDPNKSFKLRVRQQTARDFLRHIKAVVVEAAAFPKPKLASK